MTIDRILVPLAVVLGIGAGTVLPILRASAKTGTSGLTFQQPRRDARERLIGTVVGALGAAHLAWGPLYAWLGPGPLGVTLPSAAVMWSGFALYLASLVVVIQAQATMGKSWRIGIDRGATSLVTEGVYAIVRNPIYVGAIGCGWAMVIMTPSWITVAGALGYLVFIQLQARLEERHLLALHGASYRRYLEDVGRFLPLPSRHLGRSEVRVLAALAEAVIPGGTKIPAGGAQTVALVEEALDRGPALSSRLVRLALFSVQVMSVVTRGSRFTALSPGKREEALARWLEHAPGVSRHALRGLVALVKTAHFDHEATARAVGARSYPAIAPEKARWHAQMLDGATISKDETIECDVVVVGTGAGGAVVGYELAQRGHAVVFVEEGRFFGRHELVGRASDARARMFRDGGQTLAIGNVLMPVWTGVTVGGSTTINSGTCYRTPERILARWRSELGLSELTSEAVAALAARVEEILGVAPTSEALLGGGARAIQPGLAKLRWKSEPIARNAPGCDGQGRCMFGCPTGAKRSTNESYVPMALEKGAQLYTQTRATKIGVEGGRATGLVAKTAGGATLTITARATVLAGGALMTPLLLLENELANRSGMVGKNLSVHPAAPVLARFAEPVSMQRNVPQGWAVEELADEGIMIEESGNPPEVVAVALPLVGERFVREMDRYEHLAAFGTMIEDRARGVVSRTRGGGIAISYSMTDDDVTRLHRGVASVCELYLASGAEVVFPAVRGFASIENAEQLAAFRAAKPAPGDFALSAVHPLGTCRMGTDPSTSVIGPDHETHDVKSLFVVDGSAVPSALGVNPQITIMALATRAAEKIDARLR
jgi:choline dehydrogenase-like flavoprotein/protein-S-isoprenylcysteine O-methyltransferase Ste14